jgi:hypothetical protein
MRHLTHDNFNTDPNDRSGSSSNYDLTLAALQASRYPDRLPCHGSVPSMGSRSGSIGPDHPPPHFHAQYAEHEARVELETLRILSGQLPRRALGLVRTWARLHKEELRADWERAVRQEELVPIDPLP